jgi:hypothetical protein
MSGFFGSLIDTVGSALSNPATDAQIASTLGGALISSNANKNAAQTVANAQTAAAQDQANANLQATQMEISDQDAARAQLQQSEQQGIGDIQGGLSSYTSTINPLLTPNPIVLPTNQGLTQQQQIGENDLLQNANATLAASGLRGAGRAGVGSVLDEDQRYQAAARTANDTDTRDELRRAQGVANTARTGLAGVQAQAGGSEANTAIGVGNSLASSEQQQGAITSGITQNTGTAQANAATATGNTNAASQLATGQLTSSALGSITADALAPYGVIGANPSQSYDPYGGAGSATYSGFSGASA